jgi:hypothetical protein
MVRIGVANGQRQTTGPLPRRRCPPAGTSWQEGHLSRPTEWAGLGALLLACALAATFCAGLLALAVLPPLGVAVPRWLILAYGAGCVLLGLLAVRLSGPWQQRQPALEPPPRRPRSW